MRLVAQLTFDLGLKVKQKRVRYKTPTYNRFYSIWQYDRNLFNFFIQERKKGLINLSQEEIINKCLILDENGNKQRDTDERHIFRIKALHKIHNYIYITLGFDDFSDIEKPFIINGVKIFPDEQQAEILNTWRFTIKERLILHIALLRRIIVYSIALGRLVEEYNKENEVKERYPLDRN